MVLNDCPDAESIGCGFNAFKETEEVVSLIEQLRKPDAEKREIEKNMERYTFILSQYQDQPHLLDPYLERILGSLIAIVKDEQMSEDTKHNVFKYLCILMSVKTYKNIVTYLPHEVCVPNIWTAVTQLSMSQNNFFYWSFIYLFVCMMSAIRSYVLSYTCTESLVELMNLFHR